MATNSSTANTVSQVMGRILFGHVSVSDTASLRESWCIRTCTVSVDGRLNVNVALNRPSHQSSTYYDRWVDFTFYARFANDGNHNPHYTQGPCMHTARDTNPWWAVDLGVALYVAGVKFTNRDDERTYSIALGTVDNHGNTEITETVIFVKCRECRDFAKMSCFAVLFAKIPQYYVFTRMFCF